jgi:mannosyltransferase
MSRPHVTPLVSSDDADTKQRLLPVFLLVALVVLAFALRFWRLGSWGFEGDEIHTLRDSLSPKLRNPRPLLYFLNHYAVGSFVPLDEFGLRFLPALFGALAVPAFFFFARRLVGRRAALLGALLIALNPYQVYLSQYARYWSLVFLLCTVFPFALYTGVRERDRRLIWIGVITAVLAVLGHPVSVFLLGGLGLFLAMQLRRDDLRRLWSIPRVRWATLALAVLGTVVAVRLVAILQGWIFVRPRFRVKDHLLHGVGGQGLRQLGILASYVDGLTLPVVLIGALGIYLLWRGRDRTLAVLLMCLGIFPVACILLLSLRTAVSTTYFVPTHAVFFVGAGLFLDRLADVDLDLRPRWLVSAAVTVLILLAGAPTLISQYRDGRRHDFRGAARWLDERLAPGDMVFSDQFRVMTYYLPKAPVLPLTADTGALGRSLRELQESERRGRLWIVAPYTARGSRQTAANLSGLKRWIFNTCQLQNAVGVARLDFRVKELQIFRCPAGTGR